MNIKLLALDLDGTTLTSNNVFTARVKDDIEKVIKKGIHVVIATGRCYDAIPEEIISLNGIEYAVTSNGSTAVNIRDKSVVFSKVISPDSIKKIQKIISEYNCYIEIHSKGKVFIDEYEYLKIKTVGVSNRNAKYVLETRCPVNDISTFIYKNIYNIEVFSLLFYPNGENKEKEELKRRIKEIENIEITTSMLDNYDIVNKYSDKGCAVEVIAKKYSVDNFEIMACGDNLNDLNMMKLSGLSVAVNNADKEIKNIADYVTDTNDNEGVAKAIEKFILA